MIFLVRVGGGWMYLEDFLIKHNTSVDIETIKRDVLGMSYIIFNIIY